MADFTALKTAIQNAIKQNGNEEITGAILQEVMLAVVSTLGDSAINDLVAALNTEVTNRQNADGTLQSNINAEQSARQLADSTLQSGINNERDLRVAADNALSNRITAITDAIDNGYVYAGIATTSTEPVTGKVFYLTTATGVFTNFGGITDNTKGIKILKKVDSTWTSDTVIVMDDTPTENSTNLVKSGGVYASIASVLSKIAEGYLYVGVATAATNPSTPTTKVFYIAVAAGTYTNFLDSGSAALVLTQGINILKYNGTAWSVEQVIAIDDEPTVESENFVKSGGVFNDIMTNGSAFDLTAYNNGTTYADLNAALTALNSLPAAYKKGGMSMKFVLSSDNNYVQYRLKAQTFTTDITQWQSLNSDDEPTANSENLVKSGGVYESLDEIINGTKIYQSLNSSLVQWARIINENDKWEGSGYSSRFLRNAKVADVIKIVPNESADCVLAFVETLNSMPAVGDSVVYKNGTTGLITINKPTTFTINEECTLYLLNMAYTGDVSHIPNDVLKVTRQRTLIVDSEHVLIPNSDKNQQQINNETKRELSVFIQQDNIITQTQIEVQAAAGYQDSHGEIQGDGTDTNWFHTQFILVEQGTTITCSDIGGQGTAVMTVGFFDSSYNCIEEDSYCQAIGTTPVTLTVSNPNIMYVRFSGTYTKWFNKTGVISCPLPVAINGTISQINSDIADINSEIADIESRLPASTTDNPGINSDIEHIVCYGQSLSQGDWEDEIVSHTQKYNSLMFTGTMRVWEYRDQAHKYDALIPAVETLFEYQSGETVVGANPRAETPCCGTGEKAMELLIADGFNINNYQYQLLLSAPGMGGETIAHLSKGTSIYNRLLADVQAGKNLSNAAGKSFICRGVIWIQGESDLHQTYDYYYNAMDKLFNDLNDDIIAITGQSERVHFFLYQTRCYDWYTSGFHYPHIPIAQLNICLNRDDCHMVGPIYQMPLLWDWCHFTAESSKWYGGYIGKVWKNVILDGERWAGGIYLKSHQIIGNTILLQFNVPNPPLTFDVVNVPDRGVSKGFQIRNVDDFAQNSYLDIITNVEIIRPDTVRITCSQSPVGKRLTYAINGTATPQNKQDMGSGNLRDSCADVFNFPTVENGQDVEHKMYNWCPLFDLVLD